MHFMLQFMLLTGRLDRGIRPLAIQGGIMDVEKWIGTLPVLKSEKNPTTALIVGFLFGGIGLAIYFRKIIDFFIPIFAYIIIAVFYSQFRGQGELYALAGAVVAGCYGFLRARSSNEMLRRGQQAPAGASIAGASFAGAAEFCPHCGHPLDPTAAFCPGCGTHVPQSAAPTPPGAAQMQPQVVQIPPQAVQTPPQAVQTPPQAVQNAPQPVPGQQPDDWWKQREAKPADSNPQNQWW